MRRLSAIPPAQTTDDPAWWSPERSHSRHTRRLGRWRACPPPRRLAASRPPHGRPALENHCHRPAARHRPPPGPAPLLAHAAAPAAHRPTALHSGRPGWLALLWGHPHPLRAPWAQWTCAATAPTTPGERCAPLLVVHAAATGDCRGRDRRAPLPPGARYHAPTTPSAGWSRSGRSCGPPSTQG